MIKGDYDELGQIAQTHVCAYHQTPVVVAWHAKENSYVLRCGHGEYPEEVTRQLSLTEAYKAGEHIDEPVRSNIEKGMRRRKMQQSKESRDIMVSGRLLKDLGSGEALSSPKVKALVRYSNALNLDIRLDHVCLMYGQPYVTHNGYLYHANRSKKPYQLNSRPMNDQERKSCLLGEHDHGWIAEIDVIPDGSHFVGVGVVTQDELSAEVQGKPGQKRFPVVADKPWIMAQKRAEWQALKRAFPLGVETEVPFEAEDESIIPG